MALRLTSTEQLQHCSPAVRAQLERELQACAERRVEIDGLAGAQPQGCAQQPRKKSGRPEQDAGALLVEWIQTVRLPSGLRPWDFFYHVPNGGFRSAIEAKIFYGQGVRAGWPDYGLDLPLGRFHGMRLELKGPEGDKPSAEQLDFLARLEGVGYYCRVAWGFEEARDAFEHYFNLDPRR